MLLQFLLTALSVMHNGRANFLTTLQCFPTFDPMLQVCKYSSKRKAKVDVTTGIMRYFYIYTSLLFHLKVMYCTWRLHLETSSEIGLLSLHYLVRNHINHSLVQSCACCHNLWPTTNSGSLLLQYLLFIRLSDHKADGNASSFIRIFS